MSIDSETKKHEPVLWKEHPGEGLTPIQSSVNFPQLDYSILKLWDDRKIFKRSITEREGGPDYITYDGPPGTNGIPHIGNIMQSALKDLWPRYHTMKGYRVLRKAGWDTHGLPVELTAEKELGLKSKRDIAKYGVEKYIDYCRETVFRYKDLWTQAIRRIGRFLDTENYYATLTPEYIQTDWWVLKQAWDKGLLYQGRKIMPYCARCGTSLSSHETAQGYADITDISLYVTFPIIGMDNTSFVAWTTTAWTLLSNVALAVNPKLIYVTVEIDRKRLVFAEDRLPVLKEMLGDMKIVDRKKGADLAGLKYRPLWEFQEETDGNAHYVIADDYVTATDGSGIVHLAIYGEDDFRLIQKNNLPVVQNVDLDGLIRSNVTPFAGRYFHEKGLDIDILKNLAQHGLLLGKEKIEHSYPHCYRCDEPLMYFAKSSWFLRTSSFKDEMLAANEDINWYPEYIKHGRFGNWLSNNIDWSVSRERYWGSPLPIWTCVECAERVCVGSLAELGELLGKPLPEDFDPHKPHIDKVELPCRKCGGVMRREPEVLDSWFNAGIMPWGQWGYPAVPGSEELLNNQYPADFICEAVDQTRGWFYTLLAPATMLTNQSSYRNVICTELIADKHGHKMSKSRGNVINPVELCDKYGADAVRWNFYIVNPWTPRRFNEDDLPGCLKQIIIPYWNAYSFFVTYAMVDDWKPGDNVKPSTRLIDRWIMSRLEWLRESVESGLDNYDVTAAADAVNAFIDELTNWYIRRSRRRFWKSEDDTDKKAAYHTLYAVMCKLNRIIAPFLPFVTEAVYQNIERGLNSSAHDSVHLERWPEPVPENRDEDLDREMSLVRQIVTLARSLRNEGGVRVRQPLPGIVVAGLEHELTQELTDLVLDELNVKSIRFEQDAETLFSYSAKADYKALGPRLGSKVKEVSNAISQWSREDISQLRQNRSQEVSGVTVSVDEVILEQVPVDGYWVRSDDGLTVAVDNRITVKLRNEWLAREFVHCVQNLRKDAELVVTQRIQLEYDGDSQLIEAVEHHTDYIATETLALSLINKRGLSLGSEAKVGDQVGRINVKNIRGD